MYKKNGVYSLDRKGKEERNIRLIKIEERNDERSETQTIKIFDHMKKHITVMKDIFYGHYEVKLAS